MDQKRPRDTCSIGCSPLIAGRLNYLLWTNIMHEPQDMHFQLRTRARVLSIECLPPGWTASFFNVLPPSMEYLVWHDLAPVSGSMCLCYLDQWALSAAQFIEWQDKLCNILYSNGKKAQRTRTLVWPSPHSGPLKAILLGEVAGGVNLKPLIS